MTVIQHVWAEASALVAGTIPAARTAWDSSAGLQGQVAELLRGFGGWVARVQLDLSRDSAIVIATLLLALCIPSVLNSWVDRRVPKLGIAMLLVSGLMIIWTVYTYPGDYTWADVPLAFIQVIARIVN